MLERIAIAIAIFVLLYLARYAIIWAQRRAQRQAAQPTVAAALQALGLHQGPAVLAFSTPDCHQCRVLQKPALAQLQGLAPGVQVIQIDATVRPELASAFGVLTVPTTVVLDANGRPVVTNNGFVPARKLYQQLHQVGARLSSPTLASQN